MNALNKKYSKVPFLVVVLIILVTATGCLGSAIVQSGPIPDAQPGTGSKDLPPLLNYPLSTEVRADDGVPGIYSPGDILQPSKDSPLYDPDIAVVIIRDSGDGRYEIGGIVNSEGTWYRIPGPVPGLVDHVYVEGMFPVRRGQEDYNSLEILDNWQRRVNNRD